MMEWGGKPFIINGSGGCIGRRENTGSWDFPCVGGIFFLPSDNDLLPNFQCNKGEIRGDCSTTGPSIRSVSPA